MEKFLGEETKTYSADDMVLDMFYRSYDDIYTYCECNFMTFTIDRCPADTKNEKIVRFIGANIPCGFHCKGMDKIAEKYAKPEILTHNTSDSDVDDFNNFHRDKVRLYILLIKEVNEVFKNQEKKHYESVKFSFIAKRRYMLNSEDYLRTEYRLDIYDSSKEELIKSLYFHIDMDAETGLYCRHSSIYTMPKSSF